MLRLTTRFHLILFCGAITIMAITMATMLEYLFYPEEFYATAKGKKAFIVSAISVPTSLFVGGILRKNQQLADELNALVSRDYLTKLATRDFFFKRMAQVPEAHGVALMVDIDHFKRVNDTYGHMAGDHVIREVAGIMRRQVRGEDLVCRFGGEEFVVFLNAYARAQGMAAAERMRQSVADETIESGGNRLSVTISVGGAVKGADETISQAISRADVSLYAAKRGGRNRSVFEEDGSCPAPGDVQAISVGA